MSKQKRELPAVATGSASPSALLHASVRWASDWIARPQPIERQELLRFLVPLAILGFMSSRLVHADQWLSEAGFVVPDLGEVDWRQPLFIPPAPEWLAWLVAAMMASAGLALAVGYETRAAALTFACTLFYVALADRLASFTVSKLAPMLALALFLSPSGVRYGVDSWLDARKSPPALLPTHVAGGCVRFLQVFLPVFYFCSGICKLRGDWLEHPTVLWTHLHDSYQTPVSHALANIVPAWGWTMLQGLTLAYEVLAPLWFGLKWTRPFALAYGVTMHAMIGLMFGPVIWFSLLMLCLLVACYVPERWLASIATRVSSIAMGRQT
jgi:vitamin K-dependent gamma-carboxylase